MKENNSKKRQWRIIMLSSAILCLLIGTGWYYLHDWKAQIKAKLESRITKSSNGLYQFHYADISVNLLTGNLSLTNMALSTDSSRYRQLVNERTAPDTRFHIQSAGFQIQGINLWKALVSRKISIDKIVLDNVKAHVIQQKLAHNEHKAQDTTDIYDKIKDTFKAIDIGAIDITPLQLKLSKLAEHGANSSTEIDSVRIHLSGFLLNEETAADTSKVLYTELIELTVPHFSYDIANSPYKVQFDSLYLNTKTRQADINQAALLPKMSKSQYFQTDKENKALISLKFDSLKLENLDLQKMMERNLLYAEYAYIRNGSALFEKDKRYQEDNVNKIGEAPHQQVMKLRQMLRVDTIFVSGVDIAYQEYSAKYNKIGRISFLDATGHITNLTNDTAHLQQDRFMRADLHAKLMGDGHLHALFGFDMLSKVGEHSYKGKLGPMAVIKFNAITNPLLNLAFESGDIDYINFDIKATDYKHWGEFRFAYDNMSVNILNKPKKGEQSSSKDILSFLVNQLLINNHNPDKEGNFRIGQIEHTRVPEYSHFKTIWKALFEGIRQSVGLSKAGKTQSTSTEHQATEKESRNIFQKTGDFFKGLFEKKDSPDTTHSPR